MTSREDTYVIYGVDVASYQGAPNWPRVRGSGISFAFSKVTESTNYLNPTWEHNRSGMLALGDSFMPGAYHFLHGGNGAAQARYFLDHAGDVSRFAVALDVEASGADAATSRAWVAEFKRLTNNHPVLGYFPRWYWDQQGRPDLSFFDSIWQSAYVSGSGSASSLYAKVPASWWATFGNEPISLLQYSSSCVVPGITGVADISAYRGSLDDLKTLALGKKPTPQPKPQEDDMLYGELTNGAGAVTPISFPTGTAGAIGFTCDNGIQKLPPAKLRVALRAKGVWDVQHVVVDSTKPKTVVHFKDPGNTDGLSIQREDDGTVSVAWDAS